MMAMEQYIQLKERECGVARCKQDQVENGICQYHNQDFNRQMRKLRVKDVAEYIKRKGKGEI